MVQKARQAPLMALEKLLIITGRRRETLWWQETLSLWLQEEIMLITGEAGKPSCERKSRPALNMVSGQADVFTAQKMETLLWQETHGSCLRETNKK